MFTPDFKLKSLLDFTVFIPDFNPKIFPSNLPAWWRSEYQKSPLFDKDPSVTPFFLHLPPACYKPKGKVVLYGLGPQYYLCLPKIYYLLLT